MGRVVMMLLLAACGRVSFDPRTSELGDASAPNDAAELDADLSGTGIIMNPSCEGVVTPWAGFFATVTLSPIHRAGASSCQVCRIAGSTVATLDPSNGTSDFPLPPNGSMWHASAWVRLLPGKSGIMTAITIREWLPSGVGPQTQSNLVALTDTSWTEVTVEHTIMDPNPDIADFYVDIIGQIGDCMLVDDVSFVRVL